LTVRDALAAATANLRAAGIDDAPIEAQVLLQHALALSKTQLLASLADAIGPAQSHLFDGYVARRLQREPSAYIVGHKEFYALDIQVGPAVLIPRPETELLVDAVLEVARRLQGEGRGLRIADIGTGSGAIALALANNLPEVDIIATDVSGDAMAVASGNAHRLGLAGKVDFVRCDLLDGIAQDTMNIIAANLPYISLNDIETLAPEIRSFEPSSALFGGTSGLDLIERLVQAAPPHLACGGYVILEFGYGQAAKVQGLARGFLPGAAVEVRQDLAGIDRIVIVGPVDRR
jgi:release factor glutamine methyltransferase